MSLGCTDHGCPFREPRGGMGTNGGCHCLDDIPRQLRFDLRQWTAGRQGQMRALEAELDAAREALPQSALDAADGFVGDAIRWMRDVDEAEASMLRAELSDARADAADALGTLSRIGVAHD